MEAQLASAVWGWPTPAARARSFRRCFQAKTRNPASAALRIGFARRLSYRSGVPLAV